MGKVLLLYVNLSIVFKYVKSILILYCMQDECIVLNMQKNLGYCYLIIVENEIINNIYCMFKFMKGLNFDYLIECLLMSIEQVFFVVF